MSEAAAPVVTPPTTPTTPAPTTPPVEAAPPAPPAIPAEVLQRERTLRAEQQKIANERQTIAKEREELAKWKAERDAAAAPADPLERLSKTEKALADLRAETKAKEDAAAEAEWASRHVKAVEAAGDKYELTLLHGYASEVPARLKRHYLQTGEMLDFAAVADQVEKELEAAVEKSLSSKKWKAKTAPPSPPPAPATQAASPGATAPPAPKSLTNALTGSSAAAAPKGLTREQQIERAIQATKERQAARDAK